jgi:PleD family two-component response regulator
VYLVERSLNGYSRAIQAQETPLRSAGELTSGMGQPISDSPLIYIVDDDVSIARLVFLTLESQGYQVKQFHTGRAVLDGLKNDDPDLLTLEDRTKHPAVGLAYWNV